MPGHPPAEIFAGWLARAARGYDKTFLPDPLQLSVTEPWNQGDGRWAFDVTESDGSIYRVTVTHTPS